MNKIRADKTGAINLMSTALVVLIIMAIALVTFLFIVPALANKSSKPVKGLMACNTDWSKCACLLHPKGNDVNLAPFDCPQNAVVNRYDTNCPRTCTEDTFLKDLEDAQKLYKDNNKDKSYLGHCCGGNWKDYEP